MRPLERDGVASFVELGPDTVLSALGKECVSAGPEERAFDPDAGATARELEALSAIGRLHTPGVAVDWTGLLRRPPRSPVDLPTYAFQHKRFWLSATAGGDVGRRVGSGRSPPAGRRRAAGRRRGWLLTGRLSLATQPWLADHAVLGTVLLPGTAFLELLFAAGRRAAVEAVEEMTLEAPLVLAQDDAVRCRCRSPSPTRRVAVPSPSTRAPSAQARTSTQVRPWTRHASGVLAPVAGVDPDVERLQALQWPPAGAEPIELGYLYDRLAGIGFGYGPAFQVVRRAWRRGEELFVEAALSERQAAAAESFGIHPALFDAVLHPLFVEEGARSAGLPFSWSDVRLYRDEASSLRASVVLSGVGGSPTLRIAALDELGAPLLSVGALLGRPVRTRASSRASARWAAGTRCSALEWVELTDLPTPGEEERYALLGDLRLPGIEAERYEDIPTLCAAIEAGAPAPTVLFADARALAGTPVGDGTALARTARQATARTLEC